MSHSRRKFIKNSATLAALATTGSLGQLSAFGQPGTLDQPDSLAQQAMAAAGQRSQLTNGVQIGADSFADEGTEKVLDILQEKGAVNTLYLSTFTYDRGITGRSGPGKNYPGHGSGVSDSSYFHGGNYANGYTLFISF